MRSRSSAGCASLPSAARSALRRALACAGLLAVAVVATVAPSAPARADEPPPVAPAGEWTVGVVKGEQVNLRVGPRQDDMPVMQLDQGTVVVVVERAGEWLGVRVPAGFGAAVSAEYTEPVDSEHVRVTGTNVNLRRSFGVDQPPFRDRLVKGTVLPVLAREGDWLLVEAPEEVRAYVHSRYVEEKGPVSSNAERIEAGHKRRAAREALRAEMGKTAVATDDDKTLRDAMGAAGKALEGARAAGGYDVAPIAAIEDRLQAVIELRRAAAARTKSLAKVLVEDLEREAQVRVAFHDDIVAKKQTGRPAPTKAPAPAPAIDSITLEGVIRWEAAPGWDAGGAFVLWEGDKPTHALDWKGGDLKAFAVGVDPTKHDEIPVRVRVRGAQVPKRLLGLPVVDVANVEKAP